MASLPLSLIAPSDAGAYGFVIGINQSGEVIYNLQTDSGYSSITTALPHKNGLILGSLHENDMGWLSELP